MELEPEAESEMELELGVVSELEMENRVSLDTMGKRGIDIARCQVQDFTPSAGGMLERMMEEEIYEQLTSLFIAGYEMSCNTLSFAFYELARAPSLQEQVYAEVSDVLGSAKARRWNRLNNLCLTPYPSKRSSRKYSDFILLSLMVHSRQGQIMSSHSQSLSPQLRVEGTVGIVGT
ncbi:hypothetical protein JB92DRAFT_3124041 [Gautieria morchelliformis]|nr:hypothetical protein JB92DRAFT_3124041 [Gautieria morchelliformis]